MIKIKNERELISILKIFAQESVKKAKSTLNEDSAQKNYIKALERDTNLYGKLVKEEDEDEEDADSPPDSEEPEQEEEEGDEAAEEPADDAAAADSPSGSEEPEEEETAINPSEFGSSFDKVIKDLNNLRAGKSTKNKEVKENLLDYYDRLDENERKILHLFLKQLSSILQGASGRDVQDPSEPPFSFDIISSSGAESEKSNKSSNLSKSQENPIPSGSKEEDTAPPIKVNERQDLHEIRRKVKNLMKRY